MTDPDRPDGAPRGRRTYVPVPGIIDLDSVESDARDALWGAAEGAPTPDAEDDAETGAEDLPGPIAAPPSSDAVASPTPTPPDPAPSPAASSLPAEEPEAKVDPTGPSAKGQGARPGASNELATPEPATPEPATPSDVRLPSEQAAPTPYGSGELVTNPPISRPAQTPVSPPTAAGPTDADSPGTDPTDTGPEGSASVLPPSLRPPEAVVQTAKEATKDSGRELVALVTEYGKRHLPVTAPRERAPDTGPPRLVGRLGTILPIMRVIPWVLAAGFGASFLWDFDGLQLALFGESIELAGLLRILSVSGMIGFLTNWLAITMLFQPREKRAIIPQGLIPAQRERVIYRLSDAISRELINADIIKQKIQESGVIGRYRDLGVQLVRGVVEDPGFRTDLKTLAQRYARETLGSETLRRELAQIAVEKVEQQAGQGLGGVALRLYRTFAEDDFQRRVDNALAELPEAVTPLLDRIDTALDAVPAKVEARGDEIEEAATKAVLSFVESFDIQAMIQEKARGFDEAQLESLLKSTSNEQLNYIKYLGGILGVFGGLVIWRVEILVVFVVLGLVLWGLDEVLVRARRA